ncbi:hypothetical protein [Nocardia amamiensis]|uniref:hypothetical protein n=1 Tax=Nocardia amamiensis TaxID=404578 RepID=UPI00082D4A99|nr:hypothetical protein [Nocardia amamiensis]
MKTIEIFEMPTRGNLQNPSEALNDYLSAAGAGRDDATPDIFQFACMMAATQAEEGANDDEQCLSIFQNALPGWASRFGLNVKVHGYGVFYPTYGPYGADRGDASSIYWAATGFSDRPRAYEAIALSPDVPTPADSLVDQYSDWSQNAAAAADEETNDSARFSAFVDAMNESLSASGHASAGTSYGYFNSGGTEIYTPELRESGMLWNVAPFGSWGDHRYQCITVLPR